MAQDILLFTIGVAFLVKGADMLTSGAAAIAKRLGISVFLIGLTVVSFGTTAPEMAVSLFSVWRGSPSIALGNAIGSYAANTMLVLGLAALITPLVIRKGVLRRKVPFLLISVSAVFLLANDMFLAGGRPSALGRGDGLVLILFFIAFMAYIFFLDKEENFLNRTLTELTAGPKEYRLPVALGMVVTGIAALVLGGQWIVSGAVTFARYFGVSEALIALTIVAVGTSLPELATAVAAARKDKADMAVGNVLGANIMNLLWVLGAAAVFRPIAFPPFLDLDLILLFLVTVILIFLIYFGRRNILDRREGAALVGLYLAYLFFLWWRG
jgi:cation:H+ antiporter